MNSQEEKGEWDPSYPVNCAYRRVYHRNSEEQQETDAATQPVQQVLGNTVCSGTIPNNTMLQGLSRAQLRGGELFSCTDQSSGDAELQFGKSTVRCVIPESEIKTSRPRHRPNQSVHENSTIITINYCILEVEIQF